MQNYLSQPTYKAGILQSQAFRALSNFMSDYLATFDLTLSEWKLLGQLTETPKMTPSEISVMLAIKAPITSRILGLLNEKDLVKLIASKSDGRTKFVSITSAGKKKVTKIERSLRPGMKSFLADIKMEDLAIYVKVLGQIAQKL